MAVIRHNLVQNPKFENDANFWSLDADFTRSATGGAISGGSIVQDSASGFGNFTTVNDSNGYAVDQNTDYIFSFYVTMTVNSGNGPIVQINGTSAFGTTLGVGFMGTGTYRVEVPFNSGAHDLVYMRLFNNGGDVDAVYSNFMLEEDIDASEEASDWFDGDTTDTSLYSYTWDGTDDASPSTKTALFETVNETFTVDGQVKAVGLTNTFTVDGIIVDLDDDTPTDYIIYELMDEEPEGTLSDDAVYDAGGFVRLTDAVNGQDGQLEYQKSLPTCFEINADVSALGDADAIYVYWGCSATPETEDDSDGYSVNYDIYEGDGDDTTIELQFNGSELARVEFPHDLGDGERRSLKIVFDNNRIYVYVNNVLTIDYEDTARSLPGTRIGVGARTGGLNALQKLYRLTVQAKDSPWEPEIQEGALKDMAYRGVDVMKWTKDLMNNQPSVATIRAVIRALADNFNLTHISIAIPLDTQEAYEEVGIVPNPLNVAALYQTWCDAIHDAGLNVLFRGNFNGLERSGSTGNWLFKLLVGVNRLDTGTPASAPTDGQDTLLGRIYSLITSNPSWFADGDLWGPMPERTENNTDQKTPTSLERSGSTVTVTYSGNHDIGDGQPFRVSGADQAEYNGGFIATKVSDSVLTYELGVGEEPATPATGTILTHFGVSVFADENSFLDDDGGVTGNYADFFNDVIEVSNDAFASIGKNVETGWTANNYSEVNSGFIPQSLFDGADRVAIDHYGSTHEVFEMYEDIVGIQNAKGHVVSHQEWSDYWNGGEDEDVRRVYLINFYNMIVQLFLEGEYDMFNYWGGWVGGDGEGILESVGTEAEPEFEITWFGEILAQYFAEEEVPPETGVRETIYGFTLNDVILKRPKTFSVDYVFQKTDYTTINGRTVRDTSARKKKYLLGFDNLSKSQVTSLLTIIALNQAVRFTVNGKDIVNIDKVCFPYISSINYDTVGSNYLSSLTLELIEEEA